jgi:hypothetical protein
LKTWSEFEDAAPDLAARGRELLGVGVAFIATTARDASPRVHPMTPLVNGGHLLAFVAKHTVKFKTLARDSRYALHAVLGDRDEEFMLLGRAVQRDDPNLEELAWEAAHAIGMTSKNHVLMEFLIDYAHWAVWEGLGTPDIYRVAREWRDPDSKGG